MLVRRPHARLNGNCFTLFDQMSNKRSPKLRQDDAPAAENPSHHIWLAGLGAFAKAQAEGSKAFEALVRDGLAAQQKTNALAQEQLAEATQRMGELTARASDAATSRWGLESLFQDRVGRALANMGAPSPKEWAELQARVHALENRVATLNAPQTSAATKPRAVARKRSPAKKM